jgi:hypothetical protein
MSHIAAIINSHSVVSTHVEDKEIEESLLLVHRYNVPTFSPFSITSDPLVTFHILSINMDIQPSLSTCHVENFFSLDLEHVLPLSKTIGFHSFSIFLPFPFQQFCMVHHHPDEPVQNAP